MVLDFPEPTANRTIEFPDEDGTLLTTASNYSTLTSVATLVSGSIGEGFGSVVVASFQSKGDALFLSDVDLGDSVSQDGLNINAHIREEKLVFDSNSDGKKVTLEIPDPTPPIPSFDRWCSTWDGDIVKVVVGWPYDDLRKVNFADVDATFPLKKADKDRVVVFNVTGTRKYDIVNCAYNKTIFTNKTEVPDKTGFTCRNFVDVGYSCNDMVYVYGYDCKARPNPSWP